MTATDPATPPEGERPTEAIQSWKLHNPWDGTCSRNGPGEPSRVGERCWVCHPPTSATPPEGERPTTEPFDDGNHTPYGRGPGELTPVSVRVHILHTNRYGGEWLDWPPGWPLPRIGELIETPTSTATVTAVTWYPLGLDDLAPSAYVVARGTFDESEA